MVRWTQTFRETLDALRTDWPTIHPVRVRLVTPSTFGDCWADCRLIRPRVGREPYFLIRIANSVSELCAQLLLTHEYAHALTWHEIEHHDDHGPEFGIAWARTYQSAFGDD